MSRDKGFGSAFALLAALFAFGICLIAGLPPAGAQDETCQVEVGEALPPPSVVHFDEDSVDLTDEAKSFLADFAKRYAGNPNLYLCLTGQSDYRGSKEDNRVLALQRAEAVKSYLVEKGLDGTKMVTRAWDELLGDTFFSILADDETNRRVELQILAR